MDVLSWSRHHRLFPGEGCFELGRFVAHVIDAGYQGPLSLEVFNDTFRQTDVLRTAQQAKRSLTWLEDQTARLPLRARRPDGPRSLPDVAQPAAFDFVEIKAEDAGDVDTVLRQLGFTFRGHHRSKPVRLWSQGRARVVCNEQQARDLAPCLSAVGFEIADPEVSASRARALDAPSVFRRARADEQDLPAFRSPDGTEIFLTGPATDDAAWVGEFEGGSTSADSPSAEELGLTGIDHVSLAQPWQNFDEAVLFYSSVLALRSGNSQDVAAPSGLVRSQVVRTDDGAVRLALNVPPLAFTHPQGFPQHVAFTSSDAVAAATAARARGLRPLPIPANYYDDLVARFDLPAERVELMRELGVLYDRDESGDFTHFYTETVGGVFFEVVQRRGAYDGYGAANAPVRLAAQHRTSAPTGSR
jgi:4-hydroxyphenylpyruvate dioxygenase